MEKMTWEKMNDCVKESKYGKAKAFAGAGVIVSKEKKDNGHDDIFVITKHVEEVSWLFNSLAEIMGNKIDFANKREFYGTLADVTNETISKKGDNIQSIVNAVTDKAYSMFSKGM